MECGGVDLGSAGKGGPTDAVGAAYGQVKATSAPGTQGLLYLPSSTSSDVLSSRRRRSCAVRRSPMHMFVLEDLTSEHV